MFDFDRETGDIYIYDVIGPSWAGMVDADVVVHALRQMGGKDVALRINSPGGDVWQATTIQNNLERYSGKVTAYIDGVSASAATLLMLGASKVIAAENAMLMIHKPMSVTFGNSNDHYKTIEMLDVAEEAGSTAYVKKTGKTAEEVAAALEDETWFTASQALEWGLVDEVGTASDVEPQVPEGMFQKTPSQIVRPAAAGSRTPYHRSRESARNRIRLTKARLVS